MKKLTLNTQTKLHELYEDDVLVKIIDFTGEEPVELWEKPKGYFDKGLIAIRLVSNRETGLVEIYEGDRLIELWTSEMGEEEQLWPVTNR